MKDLKYIILAFIFTGISLISHAQKTLTYLDHEHEYQKGLELFDKKLYNAAQESFNRYLSLEKRKTNSLNRIDAEFFAAACALELFHKDGEWRFKQFIKNHPGSNRIKWAYFYLGKSNFRKKKYDEVIKWLEKVDAFDLSGEDLAELYFKRGYSYYEKGNFEKAKLDLYEIKDINNKYADPANYYFSHIAYLEKNYETAIEGLRRLMKNKIFGPVVPYYISQIYFVQTKYDSVISLAPSLLNDTLKALKREEICKIIGESFYKKGKFNEAIPFLKQFDGNRQPDNYVLGYCYYKTGMINEAKNYFSISIGSNDTLDQSAWYHLADCQLKTNEKNKAINSFFSAYKSGNDENIKEDALFNYAKLSYELSMSPFNDAITAFNLFIEKFPRSNRKEDAYKYLINVFSCTKNYKAAMQSIDKIDNPGPELKNVYSRMAWNLGTLSFNKGNYDSAQYYFSIAKTKGADAKISAISTFWEGEIKYRQKNYTDAVEKFKNFQSNAVSAAFPEFELSNYNIGYCYYALKDYEKARNYFDLYLKKESDLSKMSDAAARLGDCWFIKNDFGNAADNYEHAIQLGKTDVEYCMYQKAICSGRQKNYQEKIIDLKGLIEKFPKSSLLKSAYLEIAESYVRETQYETAIVWYNSYIEKFPESGMENSIKAQIAVLYNNLNDKEKAYNFFIEILKKDPKSQESQLTAIPGIKAILMAQGKMEEWENIAQQYGIPVNKDELEDAYYQKAKDKYSVKQNCEESIIECEKYISKFPDGPNIQEINFWLAECAFAKNDFEKSLQCYLFLIKQKPNSMTENALTKASFILNKNGQYIEALPLYENLIQIATDPQTICNSKVNAMRCSWNIKNFEKAAQNATLVIADIKAKQEQIWEARKIRSQCYYQTEKLNEALEDFNLIYKNAQSEQGAEALYYIATIYQKIGDHTEVEKTIDKLMSYKYSNKTWMTKGLLIMSDSYVAQKKFSDAEALLQTIIESQNDQNLINEAKLKFEELKKLQNPDPNENKNNALPEIDFNNTKNENIFEKEPDQNNK
ncbi:MAG: tetratricopeptide repeat protein [Bacteroidota bacterium]